MEGAFRLDRANVAVFARGCTVLGGGEPLAGAASLAARELERRPVEIVDLEELARDAPVLLVGTTGRAGAARFDGEEPRLLRHALDRPADAVMPAAIGGPGGLLAAICASRLGLPLVDADAAGRGVPPGAGSAFDLPRLAAGRYAIADDTGNVVLVDEAVDDGSGWLPRRLAAAFERPCVIAGGPLEAGHASELALLGTVSWALALGGAGSLRGLCDLLGGTVLADGVVVETSRDGRESVVSDRSGGRTVRVEANGQPVAVFDRGRVTASVPDLIVVADALTGAPAAADRLRSGDRVAVLAAPAAPFWTCAEGLAAAGPRALGLDFDYGPVSACRPGEPSRLAGGWLCGGTAAAGASFRAAARPSF